MLGEVLTAIVTPFDKDGAVDYDRFRALARHVIDNGADGLVVAATTGESPTLTDDERIGLWTAAVDEVGERATVIASTRAGNVSSTSTIRIRIMSIQEPKYELITPTATPTTSAITTEDTEIVSERRAP